MKKIILLILYVFIIQSLSSQITINTSDMPVVGDMINVSSAATADNINYTLTGTGYLWDFSSLVPISQTIDTFVSVTNTPIYYYPSFITSANQALKQPNINLSLMQLSNVYNFYKNASASYVLVGYAAQLNSIPVPLKYDTPDRIFKFPLNYGNIDSTASVATLNVPTLGYFNEVKKRKNIVDGWGTLKTPFGSFSVLRIKSVIYQKDSLHLDTLPVSLPAVERYITEYKWIGTDFGIPLLEIVETSFGILPAINTTINYIDSVRNLSPIGIEKIISNDDNISIYPNPVTDKFSVILFLSKSAEAYISLFDISGKEVKILENRNLDKGYSYFTYILSELGLNKGVYFINFKFNQQTFTHKLVIL